MADTWDSVIADVRKLTQGQIAQTAIAKNAEVMASPPRPVSVVRHVDGVRDAPESAVKADGVIVYDYDRVDQVAVYVLDILRELSPFDSGDYVRSHVIMLNGTPIGSRDSTRADLRPADLENFKPGDRITISNLMAYTRKIEIGRKGYRAHAHVYEKAASIAAGRYGNIAKILFTYEQAPRGGGDAGIRAWAYRDRDHSARHQEWLTRQPTIVIEDYS